MTMINNLLHPGLILLLTGILSCIASPKLRRILLVLGPAAALLAMLALPCGTELTLPFLNGYTLYFLEVERLNWVFGLIFSIMALLGGIYSLHSSGGMESLCSMFYAGAALCVALCGDWITFLFFWELMAASSLFLIWCNHTAQSRKAGFRYLLVHMFGGNLLLFGILLKVFSGDGMIANLAQNRDAAFWLILLGVAINAAVVPLHAWLPDAYPAATVGGSVFLCAFTTKVAVLALLRIFAGTQLLMWFGALMAVYGACFALIENDMRRLLSYHNISQVGFMVAGAGIGTTLAVNGATAHAFSDILFKSLLFMCAGAVIQATGIEKINQLGALAKKAPFICVCFFVGAFSISGVPLFNGFISKSITMSAAMEAGHSAIYLLLVLASIGTVLSICYKMGYFIFFGKDRGVEVKPLPGNMCVAMGMGAVLCVMYGVCPDLLYRFLPYAMDYQPFTLDHITEYVQLLSAALIPFVLYLGKMEPHSAITLDTDWFYRKPLPALVYGISSVLVFLQVRLGRMGEKIYNGFNHMAANPMRYLPVKPHEVEHGAYHAPGEYDPDAYRGPIGGVMCVILGSLLLIGVIFIWVK